MSPPAGQATPSPGGHPGGLAGVDDQADRRLQERFWRAERIAWVVFGVFVMLALAGATGSGGPLSRQRVEAGGSRIDLPRIARWQAADSLQARLAGTSPRRDLLLGDAFFASFSIEAIRPRPRAETAEAGGTRLVFDAPADGPLDVTLDIRARGPGLARYAVAGGAASGEVSTVVLP
mgnify:CR=1 FL=1